MSDVTVSTGELPDSFCRLYDDPESVAIDLRARASQATSTEAVACLFAALSNPQRLRLLWTLRDGECCVCELQAALDAPQSTVATHLRCLTEAGVVETRKDGRWSYYSVADPAVFELIERAIAVADREATA